MKKIFAITILISLAFIAPSSAQWVKGKATIPASVGAAPSGVDSALSAGVTAAYLYVMPGDGHYRNITFQAVSRRVSSAQNGKMLLEASNNGINYVAISTADSIHISDNATDGGDKFITLTSSSTAYPDEGTAYKYFRGKFTQIAGDTAYVKLFVYCRP